MRHSHRASLLLQLLAVILLLAIVWYLRPVVSTDASAGQVSEAQIAEIVNDRCVACHASTPTQYSPVASQIDLLPTLLSLMGVDSEHPAIGHDLAKNIIENRATDPGRAIMQFGGSQAYMIGGRVVILSKGKAAREYSYENQKLVPARQQDDAFKDEALAHSIWSINAYDQRLYQLHEADGLLAHKHFPLPAAAEPGGRFQ